MSDPSLVASLIKELEQITDDHMNPLEKRLKDTAIWFFHNKDRIPRENVLARLEFQEKVMNCILEMQIMLVERLQKNEGRRSSELFLPRGMIDKETGRSWG